MRARWGSGPVLDLDLSAEDFLPELRRSDEAEKTTIAADSYFRCTGFVLKTMPIVPKQPEMTVSNAIA